jgi:hypothetical protein
LSVLPKSKHTRSGAYKKLGPDLHTSFTDNTQYTENTTPELKDGPSPTKKVVEGIREIQEDLHQ